MPDLDHRAMAWSAAGGVVTIVMGALTATSPLWPVWAVLAAVGFYFTLAPLLRLPPWRRPLNDVSPPEAIGLSLLDWLRLALKRGRGFQDQTHQLALPDSDFVGSVRSWHDDIYKTLIADGEREEAQRWCDETPAIPEGSRPTVGGLSSFPHVLKQQVKCLEGVISRLEARGQ